MIKILSMIKILINTTWVSVRKKKKQKKLRWVVLDLVFADVDRC